MKKIRWTVFGILFLCSILLSVSIRAKSAQVISQGVFIDSMDVSGLTRAQAEKTEDNYLDSLLKTKVTVLVGEHEIVTTLAELGYQYDQKYAQKAANLGREGNLVERYMDVTAAQEESLVYEHSFSLDHKLLEQFVKKISASYQIPARNAQLHQKKDGSVRITPSQSGVRLVEDETAEKISRTILEDWDKSSELRISAILVEDMPAFSSETAGKCTDLLGSFTTEYPSSSEKRCKNIENAAKLINGTVLFPGQEFSMYQALYPITEENGFEQAGSFSGGKVIQSVGGGICQATTTLYNAVLWAELEVTQRNPHSLAVSYVEPGMDAAIAGTYKDLKFSNNLNAPVYIEAVTEGKSITCHIFGQEVRPKNRTISYETKVLETIEPGEDVVTFDSSMQKGTGVVTQEPYKGYKVELYKIIKTEGTGDRKEKISYSEYAAAPRYVTAGSAEPGEKKKHQEKPEDDGEQKESVDGLGNAVSSAGINSEQ